jgi:hypothetical protein
VPTIPASALAEAIYFYQPGDVMAAQADLNRLAIDQVELPVARRG